MKLLRDASRHELCSVLSRKLIHALLHPARFGDWLLCAAICCLLSAVRNKLTVPWEFDDNLIISSLAIACDCTIAHN